MGSAWESKGERLDVGSVQGFLEANVTLGLARGDVGPEVRAVLERLLQVHKASV